MMKIIQHIKNCIPHNAYIRVFYGRIKGFLAWFVHINRSKRMCIIGVTGTDGKTTSSLFLAQLLQKAGYKVGLASGQEYRINDTKIPNTTKRTTSSPFFIWKFLKKAYQAGCTHIVLETSSHALYQWRVFGIDYRYGIITNLTQEHGDYHPTMQEYAKAKAMLFDMIAQSGHQDRYMIMSDTLTCKDVFASIDPQHTRRLSRSPHRNQDGCIYIADTVISKDGTHGVLNDNGNTYALTIPIVGKYNLINAVFAGSILHHMGHDWSAIAGRIKTLVPVPGRCEKIVADLLFDIYIDFAVTPSALENILTSLQEITSGKVWLVFGVTGGQHDHIKRPMIGQCVRKYADIIVFTEDESYGEDIQTIFDDVFGLIDDMKDVHSIPDRRQAIQFVLKNAQLGDTILVSGMGDLESRNDGGKEIPRSDRSIILEEIKSL